MVVGGSAVVVDAACGATSWPSFDEEQAARTSAAAVRARTGRLAHRRHRLGADGRDGVPGATRRLQRVGRVREAGSQVTSGTGPVYPDQYRHYTSNIFGPLCYPSAATDISDDSPESATSTVTPFQNATRSWISAAASFGVG